jgi:hypothetical protein
MIRHLPPLAIVLGAAGLIPFMLLGLWSVSADPVGSLAAAEELVGYGAVILAFLGGVHWGFTLGEAGDGRAVRARLGLGVLPSLVGFIAIFCAIGGHPILSLIVLIAGYIGTLVLELRAQKRDLMPSGYLALRMALTAIVVLILATVLVVRTIGGHVLL